MENAAASHFNAIVLLRCRQAAAATNTDGASFFFLGKNHLIHSTMKTQSASTVFLSFSLFARRVVSFSSEEQARQCLPISGQLL